MHWERIVIFTLATLLSASVGKSPYPDECITGRYPPKNGSTIPEYKINLDAPPHTRWNQVAKDKGAQLKGLITTFKTFIREFGGGAELLVYLIDNDLGWIADTLPKPYGEEIKGIANATGMPLGEVVLFNIFYEIFTVCTSIVGQDQAGTLYHARNLDFGLFMGWNVTTHAWLITNKLRPMIINLDFQRGGKTVFKSVGFAGYIGIITGVKTNAFTVSMNERFILDGGFIGLAEWLLGLRSSHWVGFIVRDALENDNSYAEAKHRLSNSSLLAPCYFILGGNSSGQASVITRSREKADDIWELDPKAGRWFLLETNYDHWKAPLFIDDRRTPGNKCMQNKTQKAMGFDGLFNVLSSKPVLNKLTVYTALMQVNKGKLETYIQNCPDPCWPW